MHFETDSEAQIDSLQRLLAERTAECAAMREALELADLHNHDYDVGVAIRKALATSAGADLLKRIAELEKENESAKATIALLSDHDAVRGLMAGLEDAKAGRVTPLEEIQAGDPTLNYAEQKQRIATLEAQLQAAGKALTDIENLKQLRESEMFWGTDRVGIDGWRDLTNVEARLTKTIVATVRAAISATSKGEKS